MCVLGLIQYIMKTLCFHLTFTLAICFHHLPLTGRMISPTYASVTLDISGIVSRHIAAIFSAHREEDVRVD